MAEGVDAAEGAEGFERGHREMLSEVRAGLSATPKVLSPKWFYDERGSRLFEEITRLPEYYPTRTERDLLDRWVPRWFRELRPRSVVELGAGSARKTGILLDALEAEADGGSFVPVDVSADFLHQTAERLRRDYPGLRVRPVVADLTAPFALPDGVSRPILFALLGSTIGNFDGSAAADLLARIGRRMKDDDHLLLGVDLEPGETKPVARLEAAYNDPGGVTAAFNRNMLEVLNREVGTDFDPSAFDHRAFYHREAGRIEMHLVAREAQVVRLPGGEPIHFDEGESVRTEISCKYDRPTVEDLLARADLALRDWREDPEGLYALVVAEPT